MSISIINEIYDTILGALYKWSIQLQPLKKYQKRMDSLHQSQVKAYNEVAMKSVKEWASSFPLQPMEEGDTKLSFVNRCIASTAAAANTLPNWKLDNAKTTAMNEVRKRAIATFEKYHPAEDDTVDKEDENANAISASASGEAETADEADEESDDGAMTEDGELTGDDEEQTTTKTIKPNRKKGKAVGLKKSMAQKKGTRAKNSFRNNKGGRGARRGGRAGGRGAQK